MRVYKGSGVSEGVAVGRLRILKGIDVLEIQEDAFARLDCNGVEKEKERLRIAIEAAAKEIEELIKDVKKVVTREEILIFEAHLSMLQDEMYIGQILENIENEYVAAQIALKRAYDSMCEMFDSLDDEYIRERKKDLEDVTRRIMEKLEGIGEVKNSSDGNCNEESEMKYILVSDDLTPSQTVMLDKSEIAGIATKYGSKLSHTAILARSMGIPAIVGLEADIDALDGALAIIDGKKGELTINPDEKEMSIAKDAIVKCNEKKEMLQGYRDKKYVTPDGKEIKIYANIASFEDAVLAKDCGIDGIGLFRSEFLYMGRCKAPSEQEQYEVYKKVLELMEKKEVVIRTLDIGADKQVDYLSQEAEDNPAMGIRGIRLCLRYVELFKTQLRALIRASCHGNLSIMYPMISTVWEVKRINEIFWEVVGELKESGEEVVIPRQGIMIETPAAAIVSDELAKYVDFFSIGSNDLTQYTLAADRQNKALQDEYTEDYEAVFRLIEYTVKNAHQNKIKVAVCGELASNADMAKKLIDFGVDELSVQPGMILEIKKDLI